MVLRVISRFFLSFIAVSAAAAASLGGASAATDDVFVVARVPVQARAESATAAKANAQSQGRRRAFDILMRRITPESDWVLLPQMATSEPATASALGGKQAIAIDPSRLVDLEQSFEVYGEKSSATLYKASITYRFKPDAIRGLLKGARIPYSEAQTRTALVLPVLQTDRGAYLWEPNNPWMAAWKARPYTHELTPMIAPYGDLEDSAAVSAGEALAMASEGLAELAQRYEVSQVIVAHARLRQRDGVDTVNVRFLNGHRESGKADPLEFDAGASLDGVTPASADHGSASAFEYRPQPDDDFAADVGAVVADVTLSQPSGDFPRLAERLIDAAIAKYARDWKAKTLIDHSAETTLPATAFFETIEDWARIRSALIATPLVGAVQISALSQSGAEMEIRVFGDPSRLQVSMENQGVVFWTETGRRWFLATPQIAARYRGQSFLRERRRGLFGDAEGALPENEFGATPVAAESGADPGAINLKYE